MNEGGLVVVFRETEGSGYRLPYSHLPPVPAIATGRICTCDLLIMSQASYYCSTVVNATVFGGSCRRPT